MIPVSFPGQNFLLLLAKEWKKIYLYNLHYAQYQVDSFSFKYIVDEIFLITIFFLGS